MATYDNQTLLKILEEERRAKDVQAAYDGDMPAAYGKTMTGRPLSGSFGGAMRVVASKDFIGPRETLPVASAGEADALQKILSTGVTMRGLENLFSPDKKAGHDPVFDKLFGLSRPFSERKGYKGRNLAGKVVDPELWEASKTRPVEQTPKNLGLGVEETLDLARSGRKIDREHYRRTGEVREVGDYVFGPSAGAVNRYEWEGGPEQRQRWEHFILTSDNKWQKRLQSGKPLGQSEIKKLERDAYKSKREMDRIISSPQGKAAANTVNADLIKHGFMAHQEREQNETMMDIKHKISIGGTAAWRDKGTQRLLEQYVNWGGDMASGVVEDLMKEARSVDAANQAMAEQTLAIDTIKALQARVPITELDPQGLLLISASLADKFVPNMTSERMPNSISSFIMKNLQNFDDTTLIGEDADLKAIQDALKAWVPESANATTARDLKNHFYTFMSRNYGDAPKQEATSGGSRYGEILEL